MSCHNRHILVFLDWNLKNNYFGFIKQNDINFFYKLQFRWATYLQTHKIGRRAFFRIRDPLFFSKLLQHIIKVERQLIYSFFKNNFPRRTSFSKLYRVGYTMTMTFLIHKWKNSFLIAHKNESSKNRFFDIPFASM